MTGRGRHFAFLFLFLVRMACLAYAVCVWELMTSIKTRRAECLSRFLSWAAPLCQRAVCLGHFAGGPAMVTVRRYTGESVLLHKARWEEDGGLGEGGTFVRKPATEGGRRPCPLRRRELRASTAGQGPSFPPKSLLTYGRSAGGARRGSCGHRPACDRRG